MTLRTLTTQLCLRLLPSLAVLVGAAVGLGERWQQPAWAIPSALLMLGLLWLAVHQATAPLRSLMRALAGLTASYSDGEFNVSVHWPGRDELGELARAHMALGQILRDQRQDLVQRELLLDTMIQNTPVAMLLTSPGGDGADRVVFSNLAARKLLHGGWKLEGQRLDTLLSTLPVALHDALARSGDSLFAVPDEDDEQIYHLSRRRFQINGRAHELTLIRLLTNELRRQEVHTWKKVIRVISHELNNALAPIASLAHSGAELVRRGKAERLPEVLGIIEERARHLEGFIRGYARFAKLPAPQLQTIHWASFLEGLRLQMPFSQLAVDAQLSSRADPAQLSQALLNLVKNAHEAGNGKDVEVSVDVSRQQDWVRIAVCDDGSGMNEAVLHNALLPFYSTKRDGTGLGLALTREIAEAHGGRISLANRVEGGLCVTLMLPLQGS
jgi:two-component system, NtrC family, nitrogen regulation sensor histidine kinase NtrY